MQCRFLDVGRTSRCSPTYPSLCISLLSSFVYAPSSCRVYKDLLSSSPCTACVQRQLIIKKHYYYSLSFVHSSCLSSIHHLLSSISPCYSLSSSSHSFAVLRILHSTPSFPLRHPLFHISSAPNSFTFFRSFARFLAVLAFLHPNPSTSSPA